MVFCNLSKVKLQTKIVKITILILIDGFLQSNDNVVDDLLEIDHNPYFNRWFSAIMMCGDGSMHMTNHNPYFNRWFSAIWKRTLPRWRLYYHNPYFNRWFSAIGYLKK